MSAYQFQDQQHTEANIYNDLAQTPNPTPNDALAAANQDYAKIATTNPKSRYSKNFFIWEFLAFVAAALITAAILFVVEYHAAHTYQPVQATVVSVEPGYKGAVVFVFDYTFDGQAYSTQLVPDSPPAAQPGDTVTLFGAGRDGEPTAQDWADAAGTISYEIVTRLGARVPKEYVH